MRVFITVCTLFIMFAIAGCKKAKENGCPNPNYPIAPAIQFTSLSYSTDSFVYYGRLDTFLLSFTDGDKDLVFPAGDDSVTCLLSAFKYPPQGSYDSCMLLNPQRNLFVVDSRDSVMLCFELNSLVNSSLNATATTTCGYDGTIAFPVQISDHKCSSGTGPQCIDTVQYTIFVRDNAGHFSNVVQTPQIIIVPTL